MKPPFIETLRDPHEIQRLVFDLVNSAKQEILMLLFPDLSLLTFLKIKKNIHRSNVDITNLHGIFHTLGIPVSGGLGLGLLAGFVRTR